MVSSFKGNEAFPLNSRWGMKNRPYITDIFLPVERIANVQMDFEFV